ncbi:MAG: hypothetical protein QOJ57_2479 [Thermoleophilaceae bacterium]|nr:hypothetical protein [Thermoleophilaceae bacterium]
MTLAWKRALFAACVTAIAAATASSASGPGPTVTASAARDQSTHLISRALDGGIPNGPSTNAVISNDKRYARAIAFESEASDLVRNDTNGMKDVFVVKRGGRIDNFGSDWTIGRTIRVSRTASGAPSDGPSYSPAIGGGFHWKPRCVAFLSDATNLVRGDTNGVTDAFLVGLRGGKPKRISRPGRKQASAPTTAVAVSGNCRRIAFVTGNKLYVTNGKGKFKRLRTRGRPADPSFSTGLRTDLVFGDKGGVYLSRGASRRPRRVAKGGRNPAYNDIKRQVVTYERRRGGYRQIAYKDLGKREHIITSRKRRLGNGDSRDPVIGNAGYYVTFETDASNLGLNALSRTGDHNRLPDSYLYTNVRDITLVQSVEEKAVPLRGGGQNPSMSFYANYIVFDSPAPLDDDRGAHQIYMRYLGPV